MQSADAEHVVTGTAVATLVLPVKGMVEDIAVCSSTGAVVLCEIHLCAAKGAGTTGIAAGTHTLLSSLREGRVQVVVDASVSV